MTTDPTNALEPKEPKAETASVSETLETSGTPTTPTTPITPTTAVAKPEPIKKTGKTEAKPKDKPTKTMVKKAHKKPLKSIFKNHPMLQKVSKAKAKADKPDQPAKISKAAKVSKVAKKSEKAPKEPRQSPNKAFPRHEKNPYREGSNYSLAFDILAHMGMKKPVSRKDVLAAYIKAGKRDPKLASFDMAVVLSPAKNGTGHRSSRKDKYYVEKLENSMVQLHMA